MKPRVIIVSIDGFASFYWRDPAVRAPVLRGLAERGVLAAVNGLAPKRRLSEAGEHCSPR